jgi:hypothetical protein
VLTAFEPGVGPWVRAELLSVLRRKTPTPACDPGALGEVASIKVPVASPQEGGETMGIFWLIWFLTYVYLGLTLHFIANKTGTPDAWMAWVPILNVYLMCRIAGKPGWWVVLFFIPIVNIIMSVLVWMGIAEARNKPAWLGVLMLVPIANIVIPAHLAFSE